MGYGNAKAIFEHEFNPWLTKSYKNLWFIKGWKVRMFWNWYPSSRSMIGWLMINGCVPQQLAQTVAWFKPCSCLFTKWGSLTAQSGLERSFLKASGTQCSATCQPSTPPRTFLPAFVQRYFQTPVSIQTFGGIIVPSKVSTTCPHDIHAGHGAQKFWCGCATEACCWACRDWYPYAGSKFSGPQKEVDAPFSMPAGNSTVILCLLICYMLMYHFNPWYRVVSDLWDLISEKKRLSELCLHIDQPNLYRWQVGRNEEAINMCTRIKTWYMVWSSIPWWESWVYKSLPIHWWPSPNMGNPTLDDGTCEWALQ